MKYAGIDLGSREVKLMVWEGGTVLQQFQVPTMTFYRDYCSRGEALTVDTERLGLFPFDWGVSTGYGRNNTDLKQFTPVNEVKAHVFGAMAQTGLKEFVLLDIGGQDVKIARIQQGCLTDLELNDKCAASCGRYLENMAALLEVPLEQMTGYTENPAPLNSTCAVFSESELIGKIAEGVSPESLYAGVNYSLFKRLLPLLKKFKGNRLVLSGGVARAHAIRHYLSTEYDEIIVLPDPQYNGALGCCILAARQIP